MINALKLQWAGEMMAGGYKDWDVIDVKWPRGDCLPGGAIKLRTLENVHIKTGH